MAKSTELLAFEIQKDGYEVTVKNLLVYLCCSNVRRTQSRTKYTCQRLWNIHGAYLLPPFTAINHYNLRKKFCKFSDAEMKLIWFCREPASSRRRKISMIWQFAPLIDQISVLGGVVVPIADVECQKKCSAMVKAGSSRFQKAIGELVSVFHG